MAKVLLVSIFFCTAFATSAIACMYQSTPVSSKKVKDLVFLGEVISSNCINKKNITKFAVKKMWKGKESKILTFKLTGCKKVWYSSNDIGSLHIIYGNYTPEKDYFTQDFGFCYIGRRVESGINAWFKGFFSSLYNDTTFDYGAKEEMLELGKPLYEFK